MAATILETIAAYAKERAARDKEKVPEKEMRERALTLPKGTFRFSRALRKKEMSFICEVKKASPSKGLIDPVFDYKRIAKNMKWLVWTVFSCLTEPVADCGLLDKPEKEPFRKVLGSFRVIRADIRFIRQNVWVRMRYC